LATFWKVIEFEHYRYLKERDRVETVGVDGKVVKMDLERDGFGGV
jgi:hypothetical protein